MSTLFESTRDQKRYNAVTRQQETIDESQANITAVGHFGPYRTHRLYPVREQDRDQIKTLTPAHSVQLFIKSSAVDGVGKLRIVGE